MADPTPQPPAAPSALPPTPPRFGSLPAMAEPVTALRRELLDSLSVEFLHNYGKGRTLLAVDGTDGAGARAFADDLATRMGRGAHAVFRASIANFRRPRDTGSAPEPETAGRFYHQAFDYDLFRRVLVEPFRMGGSTGFVTAAFDTQRNTQVEMKWETGPRDATLIVDGLFLNRPELRGLWNFSVWLEPRGGRAIPETQTDAVSLYLDDVLPREQATAIIDTSNSGVLRRVFADSC